jgi:hypothetical protein
MAADSACHLETCDYRPPPGSGLDIWSRSHFGEVLVIGGPSDDLIMPYSIAESDPRSIDLNEVVLPPGVWMDTDRWI